MAQLELKDYQSEVLSDLEDFVRVVVNSGNIAQSYRKYWLDRGIVLGRNEISLKAYNDTVPGVPRVTSKVPTAGGKTFIACNAIHTIFSNLPDRAAKVVAWFVPSDTILEQTLEKLRDPNNPYRQRLDTLFNGRVAIVDKESALMGVDISPVQVREQLTIFVLSAQSFIDAKRPEQARVYRDNGYLEEYAKLFDENTKRVKNSGETGLIQVLSYLNPLIIVDESHNFTAELRVEMFNNINPCFIYEVTATPRDTSNIITFIGAEKLKKANMVKLPVIVHNDQSVDAVITNSITLRDNLERQAIANQSKGGDYIRPIVLFQAQPKTDEDSETFDKIKERLVTQYEIPSEYIAIKTANINELKGIDLMGEDCKIRYIITVNALKEGWDCPFAYILASLANRTSKIDVEQILGRILRQPYAKKQKSTFLNMSYTFTCSRDFQQTLDEIIKSLNRAGFSSKDYRSVSSIPYQQKDIVINPDIPTQADELFSLNPFVGVADNGFDHIEVNIDHSSDDVLTNSLTPSELSTMRSNSENQINELLSTARQQAEEYEIAIENTSNSSLSNLPGDVAESADVYTIAESFRSIVADIKIPQLCYNSTSSTLFESGPMLVDKEMLLENFDLDIENKDIQFDPSESSTRLIDLDSDKDYTPVQSGLGAAALNMFRQYYMTLNNEGKIRELVAKIIQSINIAGISDAKLRIYIKAVLERKNSDELIALAANLGNTIDAFKTKINELADQARERRFLSMVTVDQIFAEPLYSFPDSIILPQTCVPLRKSLYRAEGTVNPFEYRVIQKVADLDNILFWHRNPSGKGFCINGFINHYPDFIVVTKGGKVIMLETKGDDRRSPESMARLKVGKVWAQLAGNNYRYYMVFDTKSMEGAYSLNQFIDILSQIQ